MNDATLAAITDALDTMQALLERVVSDNDRIEATQRDILRRLDRVSGDQATIAEVAAHAHAASIGNKAALPVELADDPLLERYILTQPADHTLKDRVLVEWRKVVATAGSAELAGVLAQQYRPSPTDTPEARLLRYQLAAISRDELQRRRAALPALPSSSRAGDQSPEAQMRRSAELAALWRAGESLALFGDPELAGAVDLFEASERRVRAYPEDLAAADLADVHRTLGDRLAAGDRPLAAGDHPALAGERTADLTPERPR